MKGIINIIYKELKDLSINLKLNKKELKEIIKNNLKNNGKVLNLENLSLREKAFHLLQAYLRHKKTDYDLDYNYYNKEVWEQDYRGDTYNLISEIKELESIKSIIEYNYNDYNLKFIKENEPIYYIEAKIREHLNLSDEDDLYDNLDKLEEENIDTYNLEETLNKLNEAYKSYNCFSLNDIKDLIEYKKIELENIKENCKIETRKKVRHSIKDTLLIELKELGININNIYWNEENLTYELIK